MASVPRTRPLTAAERHELGGQWGAEGLPVILLVAGVLPLSAAFYYVAGGWLLSLLGGR